MFHSGGNKELIPVAKTLSKGYSDRNPEDATGALCADIAEVGYPQRVAIGEVFPPPTKNGPAARLAKQVCRLCDNTCIDRLA